MTIGERTAAFATTGKKLKEILTAFYDDDKPEFIQVLNKAKALNSWFTVTEQKKALLAISDWLEMDALSGWIKNYPELSIENHTSAKAKTIGVIMAGNIPMVGFHDFLCVLISGNKIQAKCSSDDTILLPWFSKLLIETEPRFNDYISFTQRLSDMDAVIGTGSNNSARYFDYYFGKYPHIIRKNRNAIAILSGFESTEELRLLGSDIFSYYGLGCRNVSKMYVPENYDFNPFFSAMEKYSSVMDHTKYMNNFDYYNAILLMKQVKYLTNNFLIVLESNQIPSPVSILHFEYYKDIVPLTGAIKDQADQIQCIVCRNSFFPSALPFGNTQNPGLIDYADGVDVMKFLENLTKT